MGLSGIVSGPWYYPARYLHRHTVPLRPIRPAYPRLSGETAGQVFLLMFVNERGTVDSYRVLRSEPEGMFDDIVITAFTRETYAPGLITGQAVKSQLLVEVRFEPGTDARVSILAEPPK